MDKLKSNKHYFMLFLFVFALVMISTPTQKAFALSVNDFVVTDVTLDKQNQAVGNGDTITITCNVTSSYEFSNLKVGVISSKGGEHGSRYLEMIYDNSIGKYVGKLTIDANDLYEGTYWICGFECMLKINGEDSYTFVGYNQKQIGFGYFSFAYCEQCKQNGGHTWGEPKQIGIATCKEECEVWTYCSVCDFLKKETTLGKHNYSEKKCNIKKSTYSLNGSYDIMNVCSECGEEVYVKTVTTPKLSLSKPTSVKSKSKKNEIRVSWKKNSKAKGYEIQYSLSKNYSKAKTKTSKSNSITLKKLKSNKKYYVRVRSYVVENNTKCFSKWSSTKAIKTLK